MVSVLNDLHTSTNPDMYTQTQKFRGNSETIRIEANFAPERIARVELAFVSLFTTTLTG